MSGMHAPARNEKAMKNEEVGELIGVHYSTVSRLRSGERMPSGDLLVKIVRVFRLNLTDAFNAFEKGPYAFAPYFRQHVADKSKSDFPWLTETDTSPDA